MAEGIVSLVLGKLSDAAIKDVLLLLGVGKQVERLSCELSWIQSFLKDADIKQIINERENHWVKDVRDIAYDIEDVIDNAILLKVPENPLARGCSRIVGAARRMWRKCKKLPALHNLADEMNEILARIREINGSRERYRINTFGEGSRERYGINSLGEGSGVQPRLPIRPPVLPKIDDPNVVGFDHDRDHIVNLLLDTSIKRRAVISIVGPGGLGKTTLARKVYNSNDVKRQFDICIWVTISQEFELMDILRKIIEQVEPLLPNDVEGGEEYLLTKLYKTLNGQKYTLEDHLCPNSHDPQASKKPQPKKYLLVLDMWRSDLWIKIGEVLPDAGIGSRVMVTTRIQNIIDDAVPYKLPHLTEKPSLELLLKKALPNRDLSKGIPDEMYEVGKQFAKKCGGLPLALLVLGGLLSKKSVNYVAWSKMLQTMNWGTDGRDCIEIMATSYDDLPFVLKSCFMYFAAFPEDHEFYARDLLRMWVAEGFIPAEESIIFEDTAESFLEELVQRSLVQVIQRSGVDDSITHCRIHDLLRELAILKAKEDNFLTICSNPDNWKSSAKARRVAVHYSGCNELMEHANPNLRSLVCFDHETMPNCSRQRLLKVLRCEALSVKAPSVDVKCFHGLNQLRYCKLIGELSSNRISFESFIRGLKFVETLDFSRLKDHGDLHDDIWNVKTLRHVMLNDDEYAAGPSSSANLKNLQTLRNVKSRESWNAQLPKLPNLRDLVIKVENSFSWDVMAKLLDTLNHLTRLGLHGSEVPQTIVEMQRFPFYHHLQSLFLLEESSSPNNKLSPEVGMFPIHITALALVGLQFKEDPLPVLEKLRSLRSLVLHGEVANRKMSCSDGGFQQLHELLFYNLTNIEEWEIKTGAMPILNEVHLHRCHKLRVPLGLQYLSNLKQLDIIDCSELNEHKDEIRNICKHVPLIEFKEMKEHKRKIKEAPTRNTTSVTIEYLTRLSPTRNVLISV